ncbi:hypothetical protein ACFCYN_14195 [Gottfriedia sp. NPDC056225]|uniref:hypothetical protein n=1 Tax=Gottfriedia sp. NPDC056225 TaxID=3345751 RepID=UPI0035E3817D
MRHFSLINTLTDLVIIIIVGFILFKIIKKIILLFTNSSSVSKNKLTNSKKELAI